tara:strand:- start:3206 stop:3718 length:513 start_codon:yes stop_codon:yes gene_type:complete
MSKGKRVLDVIKKIHPSIEGGYSYFETRPDGKPLDSDIEGLVWENKEFTKPAWDQISANMESEIEEFRKNLISNIKLEAGHRISEAYPDYKQRNHTAAVVTIQNKELIAIKAATTYTLTAADKAVMNAANTCNAAVDALRVKSNTLEASLDSMSLAQLEAFDPTNDINWS